MLEGNIHMVDRSKFFHKSVISYDQKDKMYESELLESKTNYFWTKDPVYLSEYANSINDIIEKETGVVDSYKSIFSNITNTMFFIGTQDKDFVGGARVSISNPYTENSLPSEGKMFSYNKIFPEYSLMENKYCEISKFAIKRKYRQNMKHYDSFFRELCNVINDLDVKYVFFFCTKLRLKLFRRLVRPYFEEIDCISCDFSDWEGFENADHNDEVFVLSHSIKKAEQGI